MKKKFINQGRMFLEARKKAGLTQQELADKLNLHSQFVSNWERGLCGVPKGQIKKTVRILKLTRADFEYTYAQDAMNEVMDFAREVFGK